jgi:hypothetical protein
MNWGYSLRKAKPMKRSNRAAAPSTADLNGLTEIDRTLRGILARRAAAQTSADPMAALITYEDLCAEADPEHRYFTPPRQRGIGPALLRIAAADLHDGLPILASLVRLKAQPRPGDGFWLGLRQEGIDIPEGTEMAYWRASVAEAVTWWSGRDVNTELGPQAESATELVAQITAALAAAVNRHGPAAVVHHLTAMGAAA